MGTSVPKLARAVCGLFVAGSLAIPSAAPAASVSGKPSGDRYFFRAGGGEKNRLSVYTDKQGRLLFKDRGAPLKARGVCDRLDKHWARCPSADRLVDVRLGSRDDRAKVSARVRTKLRGGSGRDRIRGGPLKDSINGERHRDRLWGRHGDDWIKGDGGADYIRGGRGYDRLYGNYSNDELHGEFGDDYIHGGHHRDRLHGGYGADTLRGGRGNDRFFDDKWLQDFAGIDAVSTFSHAQAGRFEEFARDLKRQRNSAVRIYRQVFSWQEIETSPGSYDFRATDRYMAGIARTRARVLPILFDAPPFRAKSSDRPNEGIHGPPKSGAALGRFGAALVRRYGPKGSFWRLPGMARYRKLSAIRSWQIWNEPNLRYYWGDRPNAREYVRVLRATYKRIRAVDRHAKIVTAGMPESKTKRAISLKKYIPAMYKAGLKKVSQSLAVNAYARNTEELRDRLEQVRGLMDKSGDKAASMWVTEIGWASGGDPHRFRKGERGQAREITKAVRLLGKLRKKLHLRGFVYYRWQDARPYRDDLDPGLWGFHAGLLEQNGKAKKARSAYRNAIRRLD